MPRIPQVLAPGDRDIPLLNPRVDPGELGALATVGLRTLARTVADVGETVAGTATRVAQAEQRKQDIAAASEATRLTTQYAMGLEDLEIALKRAPDPSPGGHAAKFQAGAAKLRQTLVQDVKDPRVLDYFAQKSEAVFRAKTIEAKGYGDQLFVSQQRADRLTNMRENTRMAAGTDDPILKQIALDTIQDDLASGKAGGLFTAEEAEKLRYAQEQALLEATALRQINEQPGQVARELFTPDGDYRRLDPGRRDELLRRAQIMLRQQDEAIRKAREAELRTVTDEADKVIRDAVWAGDFEAARARHQATRDYFSPDDYGKLGNWIRDMEAKAAKVEGKAERGAEDDDPDTMNRLRPRVFTSSRNLQELLRTKDEVLAATGQGLLPKRGERWANDLQGRIDAIRNRQEDKAEARIERSKNDIESMVRERFRVTGPGAQMLNMGAQAALGDALEDLQANVGQGKPMTAEQWYARNLPRHIAKVGILANRQLRQIHSELRDTVPIEGDMTDPTVMKDAMRSLAAQKSEIIRKYGQGGYSERRQRILEGLAIAEEWQRMQQTPGGLGPSGGAGGPVSPATGKPRQTKSGQ